MNVNKILIHSMLLGMLIFQVGLTAVHAQGPNENEEAGPGAGPMVAPSGQLNLTFKQLGYDNRLLSRNTTSRVYWIDLPGNLEILPIGNYLDLITSHLPTIPDKPAVLKVEVNGRLLSTYALTATNAISGVTRIDLPEALLLVGSNSVRVRLDTSATCGDPGALIDVFVDANSSLSFNYQQNPYPADLSLYPFPFIDRSLLEIPIAIVLPAEPTSNDLSAAATIAAGLGRQSGGSIELTTVLASNLTPEVRTSYHLIVVGQPGDNALLNDLELPLSINDNTLKPGQGVLQEIISPWNEFRLVLVASGLDSEGVLKASHTLNRQANFLGMSGPVAVILDVLPLTKSGTPSASRMTLASLGYQDETAYGAAPQDYLFNFTLPPGWRLEEPPIFTLRFTHADILDPLQSILDVKLNDKPIGSILLDQSNANGGELTLPLPGHLITTGNNRLTVGVKMSLPGGDPCQDRSDERAWTVISSQSEIVLPYSPIVLPPELRLFPYPFSQEAGFDQALFVLPDQSSPAMFDDLIQLAARMGGPSRSEYISIHTAYASEVDKTARAKYHLILLGRPTENVLLGEINDYLPQPFEPGSNILEPLVIDSVAFLPDPQRSAGLLQIVSSPWNENNSILAITGTTEAGYRLALQTLVSGTASLKGNLAVIEPAINPITGEPNQVSTYAIDTRPSAAIEGAGISGVIPENDLMQLARRWWQ